MSKHKSPEPDAQEEACSAQGEQNSPPDQESRCTPDVPEAGGDACGGSLEGEGGPDEQIASLSAALAELNDQYLRKAADFENFRKRMNREKQDAIDFANQALLLDLVPVIDDFERAIKSAESSRDFDSFYEGIGMIEKRLISQLESKWALVRFDSAGSPFDPGRHEAIMVEKSAGVTEPTVAEDFLKGFMLKDRVIRSAKVKVFMPVDGVPGEESPGADEADQGDVSRQ
ncbi:MAG: nucleotide exchange factor GrpE [Spirochaetaceae bacterium]|jgi:molecular chaperone GrpE|nr:nucleotide exchange factor GrpE [Spirochaetaceae bacterium]